MEVEEREVPPLAVQIVNGRPEELRAELLVALFFEDERPLRGPAGRVDWRLCGLASRRIAEGLLAGRPGEALLVPTGGGVAAERTLLMGLGPRPGFGADALADAAAEAARRALALRLSELALLLPPESQAGVGPTPAAVAAVAGVAEALARRDAGPLRLLLWTTEASLHAVQRGARDAVASGALAVSARLLASATSAPLPPGAPERPAARSAAGPGPPGAHAPTVP